MNSQNFTVVRGYKTIQNTTKPMEAGVKRLDKKRIREMMMNKERRSVLKMKQGNKLDTLMYKMAL